MLDVIIKGVKEVQKELKKDAKQMRFASAVALTRTAKIAKERLTKEIVSTFDKPKPFTIKSVKSTKATKARLQSTVSIKPITAQYLQHHVDKRDRLTKGFEKVLRSRELLPRNMYVVPGRGVKLNPYGNVGKGLLKSIASGAGNAGSKYFVAATRRGTTAIWQRTGRGGKTIKPVLIFVRKPDYKPEFKFYETAEKVFRKSFDKEFDKAYGEALRTAR